jgi:hypothetical protein
LFKAVNMRTYEYLRFLNKYQTTLTTSYLMRLHTRTHRASVLNQKQYYNSHFTVNPLTLKELKTTNGPKFKKMKPLKLRIST